MGVFSGNVADILFQGGTSAAVTTYLISLLRPFCELLVKDGAPLHDPSLRALNVILNAIAVAALQYQGGT
jgi:hypothetical protein